MTYSVRVVAGRGCSRRLGRLTAGRRVLVVASHSALERTGARRWLPPGTEVFSGFHPNPTVRQAVRAARLCREVDPDLVVGLGGGSAMDVAKAARALPGDPRRADQVMAREWPPEPGAGLLLVPTTAGTGSEVTQFATFYRDGRKESLDAEGVQADIAVVDPALTDSCPAGLTWSCAFDALAHAVESSWSTRATEESREYAHAALRLLGPVLTQPAGQPVGGAQRDRLSEAATLAGRAINITRTTAAHAMSYPLTVHLGVPHGLACALNLIWLMPMIEGASANGHAGGAALRNAIAAIREGLDIRDGDIGRAIGELVARRTARVRRHPDSSALADRIVREGLSSDRIGGTPIVLDHSRVRAAVVDLLDHGVPTGG